MPFNFPLQAVLHYRQSVEHQQELRLRAAHQEVARVRHLIEQMDLRRQQHHAAQTQELTAGTTVAELRFALLSESELLRHRGALEQQLGALEKAREHQREIFQQARQARETLESVREQQFRLYKKESARREQRSLDDLFLLRREYLRRG
jgi:flagellar export protein FliJ